ncbi:hypothetical protein ACYOEI_19975, partial [Singulisphaera rosea]
DLLARWDHDFQGRRAIHLRDLARRQVIEKARAHHARFDLALPDRLDETLPLIATGHQPELFHPGVWVKNFATASLARQNHGLGLNLIVDNDIPKGANLRVPFSGPAGLSVRRLEYDDWAGEIPFEDLPARDEDKFASFPDRVRETFGGLVSDPVIDRYWPIAVAQREKTSRLGLRFAVARRKLEESWGVRNLEVPLSDLCETEAFLWFVTHILAQLPRFQSVHNTTLAQYRALYGIRSKHHPVPALGGKDGWLEAPFWVWRAEEPRRRPLLARQLSKTMELRIEGEDRPLLELPLAPDREGCCAVEQLLTLPGRNVRLRTRALTTTMFSRLLLGDVFIHGIGGAKYDELGDELIRGFFGIMPPNYLTLTMTLWLGLADDPANLGRLHDIERTLRDLRYNPDRHLESAGLDSRSWIEAKRAAILAPQETRRDRLERFQEIRRCNEALQPLVQDEREHWVAERSSTTAGLRQNVVAHNREYSFVLHSESHLRDAMAQVDAEAAATGGL